MARTALTGARIFDGARLIDGHALVIDGDRIEAIVPDDARAAGPRRERLGGGILAPGFVDLQVNGGGGVMLNDAPEAATMARIAAAHRRRGTTAILPTLITDTPEATRAAIAAAQTMAGRGGVVGLHLEGPHLAPARKGAHLAERMRPVGERDVALYAAAAQRTGRLLVTLAPEMARPDQVAALAAAGVTVSLGHSDAAAEAAEACFEAGAHAVTHLFNAMSGLGHRAPGIVGAALADPRVWGGVIADGHHVDRRALTVAFAAKRGHAGRLFLVSDAMALVGSQASEFTLDGRPVVRSDGAFCSRLTLADGTLAGSDIALGDAVRYCRAVLGLPVAECLRMATADPADFIGIGATHGRIAAGRRADLVHLDDSLRIGRVWIAGTEPADG